MAKSKLVVSPESQTDIAAPSEVSDSFLECLVFLSAHFGKAKSAQSILSGLAYDEKGMGPALFCEAANRLGFKSRIVRREKFQTIPSAVLPCVIVLKGGNACVLLRMEGKSARIFLPETLSETTIETDRLETDYSGYAVFIQPNPEFSASAAPEKHDDTARHWFWGPVSDNRSIYVMALVGAVFINLFGLAAPLFIMNVYDRVIPNNAIETGWALGIGALTVFVFDLIMRTLRAYLIDLAGRRTDVIVGRRIYDQVLNMKLAGRPQSSGVFANMLRDFDSVRDFFTSASVTVLVDLPFTLFYLFVIFQIGGGLALIVIGLLAAITLIGFALQAPLKNMVRKSARTAEMRHGLLVETIHGLETIKSSAADGRFRKRYSEMLAANAQSGQASRFISGLGVNLATFIQQAASIIIVLTGMYLVQDGNLSVGGLIATVILSGRALAPAGQIANLMTRYHQAGGALKTLDTLMGRPVERPVHANFLHRPDLSGKLALDRVSFSYPGSGRKILDGVSFTITPGEKVGIIGRIGSGKSTIARLVMGLYDPDDGVILADDTDYRQIDPADLRRSIAYIAQDVVLFNGTIRDNISASVPQASEADILKAARTAGVHDFVARHPMGYDAPVGEGGSNLSGGQRQAVALARALLLQPRVMVCDEPTNAMDMQTEEIFKSYLAAQGKDVTLILITHKQTLLPLLDRLILLDHGRVVMDGPRDQIIAALQTGQVELPGK